MANARYVYEDKWGGIIEHPSSGALEIRWYDATADMMADDFNAFLSEYAGQVEKTGRTAGLVDAVQFKMPVDRMSMGWRDENIVPRYNKAGMKKFAFVMPAGMPAIGNEPAPEGPADFPTAYFGTRASALSWLTAS